MDGKLSQLMPLDILQTFLQSLDGLFYRLNRALRIQGQIHAIQTGPTGSQPQNIPKSNPST